MIVQVVAKQVDQVNRVVTCIFLGVSEKIEKKGTLEICSDTNEEVISTFFHSSKEQGGSNY